MSGLQFGNTTFCIIYFFHSISTKSSDRFRGLHKLKLMTNFDVNLASSPGGVVN